MIFFYEILFAVVAVAAVFIGETWSRTWALVFLLAWLAVIALGHASFGARLAQPEGMSEEDQRWYRDARDGLRHLRLLFLLACGAMLVWRLIAG
jgi:hypothetical protein